MSTLNVANITDGTTTVVTSYVVNGSAKAWVHYTGVSTATIQGSLNASSITDNGTGIHTLSYTNAMTDAYYACPMGGRNSASGTYIGMGSSVGGIASSSIQMRVIDGGATFYDYPDITVSIHGDLA